MEQHRKLLSLAGRGDAVSLAADLTKYLSDCPSHHVQDVVHARTGDGLLHVAARGGHVSCLELLLTGGCNVDQRSLEYKTPLHEAAQAGHLEVVRLLLEAGAEVDSLKRADWTPMMLAATKAGNVGIVEELLEAGADPRTVNKDGWTALHLSVRTGDLDMVHLLTSWPPDCAPVLSNNGRSLLHTASLAGLPQVVSWLVSLPSLQHLLTTGDTCGSTPLMEAARGRTAGHLECVNVLLAVDEDQLSARDKTGRTVVEVAAQAGAVHTIRHLGEERGLDLTLGLPLHAAAREGQAEVITYLLSLGTEVDTRDERGRTALFLSVSGQHEEATSALLEAGADLSVEDKDGVTVRSLARKPNILALMQSEDFNQFL